jgi:Lrp/AsnC family leucine-responsive transcriptional regulator
MLIKTPKHIDRIDRNILIELQKNGKITNSDLADKIGLSASPCLERVKRLEVQGYITGYHARVDHLIGRGHVSICRNYSNKNIS